MPDSTTKTRADETREESRPNKGVAIKLFGVVLIILGALDSMLSWRGGFVIEETYALLMAVGVLLYAIGSIRGGKQT